MKKPKARLKRGPDIADYVVETIEKGGASLAYKYFTTRAEARWFFLRLF